MSREGVCVCLCRCVCVCVCVYLCMFILFGVVGASFVYGYAYDLCMHHSVMSDSLRAPWTSDSPGSSVPGIFPGRAPQVVTISYSRVSSWPEIKPMFPVSPALQILLTEPSRSLCSLLCFINFAKVPDLSLSLQTFLPSPSPFLFGIPVAHVWYDSTSLDSVLFIFFVFSFWIISATLLPSGLFSVLCTGC